jgi:hypothetical protein
MRLQDLQKRLGQNRVRLIRLQRQAARMLRVLAELRDDLSADNEPALAEQAV